MASLQEEKLALQNEFDKNSGRSTRLEQVLKDKDQENEHLLVNNRRLTDLNACAYKTERNNVCAEYI